MFCKFTFTLVAITALFGPLKGFAAIPEKAVAFFNASSCPAGWKEADYARGRLLLGVNDSSQVGVTAGTPLANLENREHEHAFTISTFLKPEHIAAAGGCCNGQGAKRGKYDSSGDANKANSQLPFMQLLACEKEPEAGGGTPLPVFTAMFFNDQACPTDWQPYQPGNGRFLMPLMADGDIGAFSGGAALTPGQQRDHVHGMSTTIKLGKVKYVGIKGCCNNHLGKSRTVTIGGFSNNTDLEIPYVSQLICLKGGVRTADPAPSGMVAFFPIATACPTGWSPTPKAPGRFLVGLPQGGQVAAEFGGTALTNKENRTHEHDFSGELNTSKYKVALAKGCCAKGYAKDKKYDYADTSYPGVHFAEDDKDHKFPLPGGLPYQQVLTCSKN